MINIEKIYIRMLYPKGDYTKKLDKLLKKWDDIGFLSCLDKFNKIRASVLFELLILKFNTDFIGDKLDFSNIEVIVYPIVRRIIPEIEYDKIIDIDFIVNYVSIHYPKYLTEYYNKSITDIGLDFEAMACLKVSEELIKIINNK